MQDALPVLEKIRARLERGPGQAFMDLPFELRVTEKKPHGPPAPKAIQKTIARYYDDAMANLPKHMQGADKSRQKSYAAGVAWKRYCKYKNPGHPSCKTSYECVADRLRGIREAMR
jgi:hypothetical protein